MELLKKISEKNFFVIDRKWVSGYSARTATAAVQQPNPSTRQFSHILVTGLKFLDSIQNNPVNQ